MKANNICSLFLDLQAQGFSFLLYEGEKIKVAPANKLTEEIRDAIREKRAEMRQAIVSNAILENMPFWPMVYDEKTVQSLNAAMMAFKTESGQQSLTKDVVLFLLRKEELWGDYWHELDGFFFICDQTDYGYVKQKVAGKSRTDKRLALASYSLLFLDSYKKIGSIAKACCIANTWIRTGEIKGKDCPY
jgi:hypothetical protein